jgi:hypothetical protein
MYSQLFIFIAIVAVILHHAEARINAVAVFRRDEVDFHKYSAVLAAIEPFRLQLSEEVKQSMNPIMYMIHKWKGSIC